MHQHHPVDRGIGERQFILVDQRGERGPGGRPFHHALACRHEGEAAFGLLAEKAEIGRRIADADHALAGGIAPQLADAAANEAAGHHAQALAVKIAQIDDIDRHAVKLSRSACPIFGMLQADPPKPSSAAPAYARGDATPF